MVNSGKIILIILQVTLLASFMQTSEAMERRRDQFTKEPGHYIIPMPYSLPGIGDGFLVAGTYNNAHDSHTDYIGFLLTGDLEGGGLIVQDVHLIPDTLIADFSYQNITKGTVNNYNERGMASGENDYTLLDFEDNEYSAIRLTSTFYDRMFEVNAAFLNGRGTLVRIRDRDGNVIQESTGASGDNFTIYTIGVLFDWTDDYYDPRRGVRYQFSRWWRDETDANVSDYYQLEHNLTGYIPMGKRSTWAFNYFQSDAHVTRQGDINFSSVESRAGLNCSDSALSPEQQNLCTSVVDNQVANNTYGTAAGLGGWSRLRSYPNDRYKGAHAQFIGTEFRWNLTEEFKPFDIGIAKDIRTGIQLAAFYERATVADEKADLGNIWRDTYGIGARMVTASGLVIRGDYATGDEGPEVTVIVGYPWESF